jgi:hypothetical protein
LGNDPFSEAALDCELLVVQLIQKLSRFLPFPQLMQQQD